MDIGSSSTVFSLLSEIQAIKTTLATAFTPAQTAAAMRKRDAIKKSRKMISKKRLLHRFLISRRKEQTHESYSKRATTQSSCSMVVDQRHLECPICMDFLVNPVQTQCGHTFCEICLTEALLKSNICAMCKAVIPQFSFHADPLIETLLIKHLQTVSPDEQSEISKFQARKRKFLRWNLKRRPQNFTEGMKVDLRDLDGIWCSAVITRISFESSQRFLFIHYEGWSSIYDEMVPDTSNRIAAHGFFTQRSDVASYMLNRDSGNAEPAMSGIVLLGAEDAVEANLEGDHQLDQDDEEGVEQNAVQSADTEKPQVEAMSLENNLNVKSTNPKPLGLQRKLLIDSQIDQQQKQQEISQSTSIQSRIERMFKLPTGTLTEPEVCQEQKME